MSLINEDWLLQKMFDSKIKCGFKYSENSK